MSHRSYSLLPFTSLIGQDDARTALLMLAVNPRLNGVLIYGEKGTAKSTAARGLSSLLPDVQVNDDCDFGCSADHAQAWCTECQRRVDGGAAIGTHIRQPRFETLPLGVSEDQLLGSIDLEHALQHGERRFEPGLMARVNHGVLYVDEVNLLDDHIVDLLLDVAATGVNVVAREGVKVQHPANFLLVGTMNPEEGELRPQLLDRFGLSVEVKGVADVELRAEIISRVLEHEADPEGFAKRFDAEEDAQAELILSSRQRLRQIKPDRKWYESAARLSLRLGVDGHRGDILLIKAACALAALDGRTELHQKDVERASGFVYLHRRRRRPFDDRLGQSDDFLRDVKTAINAPAQKKKKMHHV